MIFFDVDTQRDFMESDGALYVPYAETIRLNIERLLRAASERKITTVSSSCAHEAGDPEFQIFPPHCLDGERGAAPVGRLGVGQHASDDRTIGVAADETDDDLLSDAWDVDHPPLLTRPGRADAHPA